MEGTMTKYIDAEKLRAEIDRRIVVFSSLSSDTVNPIRIDEDRQLLSFIDSLQQEQPAETDEVKWQNDEDYDETDKGRFVLGSVGIGYNGYYIPYSDLLKLPKEE
jgi:hypothetical protein